MLELGLDLLPLIMLAAVLGLDVVGFPQAMISRPLVAGTLGGALVGGAGAGLLVGALLELFALETLPFGASRYPEWGSASAVAGGLYASQPEGRVGALALAVLLALALAQAGGLSMVVLRRLNARWAHSRAEALERGSGRTVVGLQVAGLTADLVRGALVGAIGLVVGRLIIPPVLDGWTGSETLARGGTVAVAVAVAAAAAWKLFHAVHSGRMLFLGGLAAGLTLLLALL